MKARTGVTCLLLADGSDLVAVVEGRIDLGELLTRKRRHTAETGCPLLTAAQITAHYAAASGL